MVFYKQIQGTKFADKRGGLNFFNDFDMGQIVRMYQIAPSDTTTIRGWQGHKKEKKWFYCNAGSFVLNVIEVDDFDEPSKSIQPQRFILDADNPSILEISGRYATAFKAQDPNAKLLVFSDFSLEESKNDDFRFAVDFWKVAW